MTSRYSRYCKGALQPKPDRRAISKSLRDLERLFGGIPKTKAADLWQGQAASENQLSETNPTGNERPEQAGQE